LIGNAGITNNEISEIRLIYERLSQGCEGFFVVEKRKERRRKKRGVIN
jgi:hypothetical protein